MYDSKIWRHVMAARGGYATAAECSTVNLSWDDEQSLFKWKMENGKVVQVNFSNDVFK